MPNIKNSQGPQRPGPRRRVLLDILGREGRQGLRHSIALKHAQLRLPRPRDYVSGMTLRSWRKYRARRVSDEPKDKAEHFVRCPACGGYFDLCDAGQVFDHLGPLPHPVEAQPQ